MQQNKIPKLVDLIAPVATTAGLATSGSVDTIGFDEVTISVQVKQTTTTGGSTSVEFSHSDDNTTFVTVAAAQSVTAGTNSGLVVCHIPKGYNKKRYVKATATQATVTNTTGTLAAQAILNSPEKAPESTSGMVGGAVGVTPVPSVVVQIS